MLGGPALYAAHWRQKLPGPVTARPNRLRRLCRQRLPHLTSSDMCVWLTGGSPNIVSPNVDSPNVLSPTVVSPIVRSLNIGINVKNLPV
jgi:hypothetical protein